MIEDAEAPATDVKTESSGEPSGKLSRAIDLAESLANVNWKDLSEALRKLYTVISVLPPGDRKIVEAVAVGRLTTTAPLRIRGSQPLPAIRSA